MSPVRRVVLFVEVPSFYAAVERAADPELRARPVIVGGDPRERGQVQSASPDALEAGVCVGMPMLEALDRCPRARAVRTNMKTYREVAGLVRAILRSEAARLEPMGLEGAFLELAGDPLEAVARAAALRERVRSELGLDTRVGLAPVKFLARVAAGRAGPSGVLEVRPGEEAGFLAPLRVEVLPGVGPRTLSSLRELGIEKVSDLQACERERLEPLLGNHGLRILELARGEDPQPVRGAAAPRTLSQEHTFEEPQLDLAAIGDRLQALAASLEVALRRQGLGAKRVAVRVRYADHESATRSHTLPQPVRDAAGILETARTLLGRTHAGARGIRGIGISLATLDAGTEDSGQLELFGGDAP